MILRQRLRLWTRAAWPPLPVWKRLDIAVGAMTIYSVMVGAIYEMTSLVIPNWTSLLTFLNVIILGVLLQFRNRESYDRWWEARRLWGNLVNDTRNLCMKVAAHPKLTATDKLELGRFAVQFAIALKDHLRAVQRPLPPGVEKLAIMNMNFPLDAAQRATELIRRWRTDMKISDWDLIYLDKHMVVFGDVLGACERIKNTPLPLSYRSLLRHGLFLYLLMCPWLVFNEIRWWGIPAIALLTYFMLGIELTAEDVEEPFGRDADDLSLTAYCETIRKSAAQVLHINAEELTPGIEHLTLTRIN